MACGRCNSTPRRQEPTYVYTDKDGNTKTLSSETEAKAKVRRSGGSYTEQK